MGTEKEQDEAFSWALRGPDGDGCCWIDIDVPDEMNSFNLGSYDQVGEKLADWLGQSDFGERPPRG